MEPKISIIVPIYNAEKYLHPCLDSIVLQTLKEIEIICVVNGCTDNSLAIVHEYQKNDVRIMLFVNETADVGAARNRGVREATGEYLMFVDSDDWIELEACEKLYAIAKKNDLEILQGRFRYIPYTKFKNFKCNSNLFEKELSGMDFWRENETISLVVWDKIWHRTFYISKKLFNPENVYYEDNRTNVLGIINAKYFMISDFIFYNHRYVSTSIMNSKLSQKHIQSLKDLYLKTEEYIDKHNLWNESCIVLFYIRKAFIFLTFSNHKKKIELIPIIRNIKIKNIRYFPLKIKLAYYAPLLTSYFYPIWIKRHFLKLILSRIFEFFSNRINIHS